MLNQALVTELQAIGAEQRNGSLVISLGSRRVRFGFEHGELVLLDLGEEKEVAMARKLLDYHKIGPEIHRHAVNTARATGASIIDTLRRQQLVAENEIDLVAQSMVEDLLALVFSLTHADLTFTDEGAGTYNLDRQAVRLRIDVESLLAGVQARLDEEDAIVAAVGGFSAVFATTDAAPNEDLDEFELHLMNLIDGKKSIENLAVSFRDSDINMARSLAVLLRKGAVVRVSTTSERRAAGSSVNRGGSDPSGTHRVNSPSTLAAPAAEAGVAPASAAEPFQVYRPTTKTSGNLGARVALGAVFIVVVTIGWVVVKYGQAKARVDSQIAAVESNIIGRKWDEARIGIDATTKEYGGDLAIKRRIDDLQVRLNAAIENDAKAVADAIAKRDLTSAERTLSMMPPNDARTITMGQQLAVAKQAFGEDRERLDRVVRDHLEAGHPDKAFAIAEAEGEAMQRALLESIDRWRLTTIEQAGLANQPMGRRQQLINTVLQAKPSDAQMTRIKTLQEELLRFQSRREEQLAQVQTMINNGDWVEALGVFESQRLLDQIPGSKIDGEARATQARIGAVKAQLEGLVPLVRAGVTDAVDLKSLARNAEALQKALTDFPRASNRAELVKLADLLAALQPVLGAQSTEDEMTGLQKLAASTDDTAIAKAITARIATLRRAQDEAAAALERARQMIRDGQWDEGLTAMERIGSATDWSRTSAGRQVAEVIAQTKLDREKHQALEEKFRAALTAGDINTAFSLARELGRPYLPVLVESTPMGAAILRDGKSIGSTPLILEISAAERVDIELVIQLDGYTPATLKGAEAVGGWRLAVDLERKPAASVAIGELITSQPGSDGQALWLANSRMVARIASDGSLTTVGYGSKAGATGPAREENAALDKPVYAAPAQIDGAMLLSTRDGFVLRIEAGSRSSRLAVNEASDFAPAVYRSQVILDRQFLILAGTDGSLVASDPNDRQAGWRTPVGAAFISTPVIQGDLVLAARRDGTLIACQIDRGEIFAQVSVGPEILAVWPHEGGLRGLTRTRQFTWMGRGEPTLVVLPREIVGGNQGVLVTKDRQVLIDRNNEWQLLGSMSGRLSGVPVRWGDRAVIPEGGTLEVLGIGGFRLSTAAAYLNPVVVGDRLAVATADGQILFYDPR